MSTKKSEEPRTPRYVRKTPRQPDFPTRESAIKFLKARGAGKVTISIYRAVPDKGSYTTSVLIHEKTGVDYGAINTSLRTLEHAGLVEWKEIPGKRTCDVGGKAWSICFKRSVIVDRHGKVVDESAPFSSVQEEFLAAPSIFHAAARHRPDYKQPKARPWYAKGLL